MRTASLLALLILTNCAPPPPAKATRPCHGQRHCFNTSIARCVPGDQPFCPPPSGAIDT